MKKTLLVLMLSSSLMYSMDTQKEVNNRPANTRNNKLILEPSEDITNVYKRIVVLSPKEPEVKQPFYVGIAPRIFLGLFLES